MRAKLETVLHLLQLVQLEIAECGGCTERMRRRIEAACGLLNDLMGVAPRHKDENSDELPPA